MPRDGWTERRDAEGDDPDASTAEARPGLDFGPLRGGALIQWTVTHSDEDARGRWKAAAKPGDQAAGAAVAAGVGVEAASAVGAATLTVGTGAEAGAGAAGAVATGAGGSRPSWASSRV